MGQDKKFDIAIVGAGPAGKIAALMLAKEGFEIALVAPTASSDDGRTTALWQDAIKMLVSIGVWETLQGAAAPLKKMQMIDDTNRLIRAPETVFDAAELKLECFGYNLLNTNLNASLEEIISNNSKISVFRNLAAKIESKEKSAELVLPGGMSISADLVIGADGRNSIVRESSGISTRTWSYPQVACVLNLEHSRAHDNISTEFHRRTGPFTLVPLSGNTSSLVCVETEEGAADLLSLKEDKLALELEKRAHSILGKFKIASPVQSFPLSGLAADTITAARIALIAEAAHVFPPIGAQGLNLSMRDILALTDVLKKATKRGDDIGGEDVLNSYRQKRLSDIRSRTQAVDALNRSLLTDFLPVQAARSVGMSLAGKVGPLRRFLMREGMSPGSGLRWNSR